MIKNNNIIVDLSKVSYAKLQYITLAIGITYRRISPPLIPTVNGREIANDYRAGTNETLLSFAKRKQLIDTWHPELTLQLSNNHSLIYTGRKALSIWEAWKAKCFGKKKS